METNWFKRHVNWTWVGIWILTITIAYSVLIWVMTWTPPILLKPIPHDITTYYLDGTVATTTTYYSWKSIPDEQTKDGWVMNALIFWWWPVYVLGIIGGGRWVIKQKNRSNYWLFPSLFIWIIPLLLTNKTIKENENGNIKQES